MIIVGDKKKVEVKDGMAQDVVPYGSDYANTDNRLEDRLNERMQIQQQLSAPIEVQKNQQVPQQPVQQQQPGQFEYIGPQPNEYYNWEIDKPVKLGPSEYRPGRMIASVDAPTMLVSDDLEKDLVVASTSLNYNTPDISSKIHSILERERNLEKLKQKTSVIRKQPTTPVNTAGSQEDSAVKQPGSSSPATIVKPNTDEQTVANTDLYSENIFDHIYDKATPISQLDMIPGIQAEKSKIQKKFPKGWSDDYSRSTTDYDVRPEFYKKNAEKPEFVFPTARRFAVSSTPLTERKLQGEENARPHHGFDLETPIGTSVYSAGDGTVVYSGAADGYGNMIIVHHPQRGIFTHYAHLKGRKVKNGQKVEAGQLIGLSGNSTLKNGKAGKGAASHLHFEVYKNDGELLNPIDFFNESLRRFDDNQAKQVKERKDYKQVGQGRSPSSYGIFLTEEELQASSREMMDRGVEVASLDYKDNPIIRSMYDDEGNLKKSKTSTELELQDSISATKVFLSDLPSDQAKRLLDLSKKTGVNPKLLQGREDEVERQLRDNSFNAEEFVKSYPKLSEMMAKDPYLVPLVRDEQSVWNTIKGKTKAGAQEAEDTTNLGGLGKKMMDSPNGELTQQEAAQVKEIEKRLETSSRINKDETTGEWLLRQQGYSVSQMWDMAKEMAPIIGSSAAGGAAVAGMAGMSAAPFTAFGGAIYGAGAGAIASGFKYSYDLESGLAYIDARKKNEFGESLSHDEARDVARVVGAINAAIEVAGEAVVARFIPGIGSVIGSGKRAVVKEIVKKTKSQLYKDALKKAAKYIAAGQVQEGIEEFVQSFVSGYGVQAQRELRGKAAPGSTLSAEFAKNVVGGALEEAGSALVGVAPAFTIGTTTATLDLHSNIRKAAKSDHILNTMVKAAEQSKIAKTNPDIAEPLYQAALEDAYGAKDVLLDAEDVQAFFQTTEIDGEKLTPEQGAEKLLGPGGAAKLADALKTGKPLVVKSGKILAKTAENKELSKLLLKGRVADSVFNKDQMKKEIKEAQKRQEKEHQDTVVRRKVYEQMVKTDAIDPYTANQLSEIYVRNISNLARLTLKEDGTPMTTEEYHEANPIKFSKLDKDVINGFVENDVDKAGTINKILGATIFKDGRTTVLVDKKANPYTFIHEIGHALLERWAEARDKIVASGAEPNEIQKQFLQGMDDVTKFLGNISPDKAYKELQRSSAKALAEASLEKNKDNKVIQKRATLAKSALDHVNANGKESYMESVVSSLGKDIRGKDIYTDIMRPYHEALAEAYEKYIASGQAPTSALKKIFIDLSSWAISVFKTLKAFGVNVPSQVNTFFGNMLTLEGEVALQEKMVGLSDDEISEWASHDGLHPDQKAKIIASAIEAKQAIHEKLFNEANQDYSSFVNMLKSKAWDEVEEQVKLDLDDDALFSLYSVLKDGKLPSGKESKAPFKINKDSVSKEASAGLPRSMFVNEGGDDASVVAESFGMINGDQLMEALKALPPIDDEIERRTEERMAELFNDALIKKEITTQAEEWVYSEDAAKVMRMEFDFMMENAKPEVKELIRDLGRMPSNKQIEEESKADIYNSRVKDLDLRIYKGMEQKNRYAAANALSRGDLKEYRQAKERQLRGHYLYRAALDARASIRKSKVLFGNVIAPQASFKSSKSIGAIAAAKSLLRRAGVVGKHDDVDFILARLASADPEMHSEISKRLQNDFAEIPPKTATELTVGEFKDLFDKVKEYYKQSRLDTVLEAKGEKETLQSAADSIVLKLSNYNDAEYESMSSFNAGLHNWKSFSRTMRQWSSTVFGFDTKEYNLVFGNIDAADNERLKLRQITTHAIENKYREVIKKLSSDKIIVKNIEVNGKKVVFDGQIHLLGMLRHMGNESSRLKYIVGNEFGTLDNQYEFDQFFKQMIDDGQITEEMMDAVQFEWDIYENILKEKTQKAYYEKYGVFHGEIQAKPLTMFGKEYRGGYAPLEINRQKMLENGVSFLEIPDEMDKTYSLKTVNKKFTFERTDKFYPVNDRLDDLIPSMDRHVRFATMTKAVDDARALLSHPDVTSSINKIDPHAMDKMVMPFIYRAATGNMRNQAEISVESKTLDRFSAAVTSRMAVVHLGWSLVNIAEEFYGRMLPRGIKGGAPKNTPTFINSTHYEFARQNSPKMKQFLDDYFSQSEIFAQSILPKNKVEELGEMIKKGNFWLQWKMGAINRVAHFYGKYTDVFNETNDHEKAVREADHFIATVYGYHSPTEASSLIAMNKTMKMLGFMYLGYFNTKANMVANNITDIKYNQDSKFKNSVRAANMFLWFFLGEAMFSIFIRNAWNYGDPLPPSDDSDDGPIQNALKLLALQTGGSVAALTPPTALAYRSIVNKLDKNPVNDKVGIGVLDPLLNTTGDSVAATYKLISGKKDQLSEREVNLLLDMATFGSGLPIRGGTDILRTITKGPKKERQKEEKKSSGKKRSKNSDIAR